MNAIQQTIANAGQASSMTPIADVRVTSTEGGTSVSRVTDENTGAQVYSMGDWNHRKAGDLEWSGQLNDAGGFNWTSRKILDGNQIDGPGYVALALITAGAATAAMGAFAAEGGGAAATTAGTTVADTSAADAFTLSDSVYGGSSLSASGASTGSLFGGAGGLTAGDALGAAKTGAGFLSTAASIKSSAATLASGGSRNRAVVPQSVGNGVQFGAQKDPNNYYVPPLIVPVASQDTAPQIVTAQGSDSLKPLWIALGVALAAAHFLH